jgi:hypothetical protein
VTRANYNDVVTKIQNLTGWQSTLASLGVDLPTVTVQALATADKGINEAKKNFRGGITDTNTLQPQFNKPVPPSDMEVERVNRILLGVVAPYKVFADPTPEGLLAVRSVYPAVYKDFERALREALADGKVKVPYNRLMQISQILSQPVDFANAKPKNVALIQAVQGQPVKKRARPKNQYQNPLPQPAYMLQELGGSGRIRR